MLLGIEIGMIGVGLYALVAGKLTLTRNRVVYGAGARLLGLICLMPFILAFCVGFVMGFHAAVGGRTVDEATLKSTLTAFGLGAIVFCALLAYSLGMLMTRSPRRPARYPPAQTDAFLSCLPNRSGNASTTADSIQAAVPLSTMAHVRCQTPRRVAEVERPAESGRGPWLWIGVVMLLYYVLLGAGLLPPLGDHPFIEAAGDQAPAAGVPPDVAPQLLTPGACVYLSDLPEFGWKGAGGWTFGKGGRLGNLAQPEAAIVVRSRRPAKALSMQPPRVGHATVSYYLGRRAQTLDVKVCLTEDDEHTKPSPTRFEVFGDGQLLWRSPVIANFGETSGLSGKDVSQVDVLELRTSVDSGDGLGTHAIWLNPFVVVRKEAKATAPR